ncbi:hypothetical protein ACFQZ4_29475 [Catellatospora coxensis]|uniref:Uncharacterized protein n=1 Tax=Catellatospora coxensis TaxID=310354 RepID=A0A8J3PAT4_9ACTN|nr:hypothetical protein [Catellatospora coxensis]GIG09919.1 hypothetical protein Cco03nite_66190 [Catellatospora coxensis]
MELRPGPHWGWPATLFAVAALQLSSASLADDWGRRFGPLLWGTLYLTAALVTLLMRLRPFRFRIDERGLTIRHRAYEIAPAWSEIEMVILAQSPPTARTFGVRRPEARLLLVPAPDVDLGVPLTARSPLDGRPCLPVIDFELVRDKPRAVAATLALHGGDRFVDDRKWLRKAFKQPDFTVRPFGYDRAHIDDVIRRGRNMLDSTDWRARRDLALELLPPHPIKSDGYDRAQVDKFTSRLSALIATLPGVPPPPD